MELREQSVNQDIKVVRVILVWQGSSVLRINKILGRNFRLHHVHTISSSMKYESVYLTKFNKECLHFGSLNWVLYY